MATLNKTELHRDVVHAGEYGNVSSLVRKFTAQALASGDVLHVARIPAHTDLLDLTMFNGAGGGTAAVNVGYVPVDDDNGAGDPTYFMAGKSVVAAGRNRADSVKAPVNLPYPVDIIITATAAVAANDLVVQATYEWVGR